MIVMKYNIYLIGGAMELFKQLNMAIHIATDYHNGQIDKSGEPYILHPIWVMNNVKSLKGKVVAMLHDIVEDTEITIENLIDFGFDEDIVIAIDILTKKKGQKYTDYIELVGKNNLAREVKISDLKHNMDLKRLKEITDKDKKRYVKYKNSYDYLIYLHYK